MLGALRKLTPILALFGAACFAEPPYLDRLCSAERPCPDGYVCRSDRCARACDSNDQCGAGETCQDRTCSKPVVVPDSGTPPVNDCAACDLPAAACLENDTVYRAYVNLGACPDDPGLCIFSSFDTSCPSCNDTCLVPCTEQVCDELQGGCRQAGYCVPSASGTGAACAYVAAADSSTCTTSLDEEGLCESGVCVASEPPPACDAGNCDDQNPCTDDSCDPETGCVFEENNDPCDDEDLCTHTDHCESRACGGTPILCESDACMVRACNGTANCTEDPQDLDTPCASDSEACTRDVCDGSGTCIHPSVADGTQCGGAEAVRCCNGECVDITTDERHCGGCGTACDTSFDCEPIESTPDCGASYPPRVSGRCLCAGANSQCPNNRGQVCRLTTFLDGNRCVPDSTTAMPCSAGQTVESINMCPGYCAY